MLNILWLQKKDTSKYLSVFSHASLHLFSVCYSLGKTIQVIAFLSGMFDAEKIQAVLIVLPVAVIVNWEREFEKW